jgi:group I intron endonuclease
MVYGIVYKFQSPSGGIYIGQTRTTIKCRVTKHCSETNKGSTKILHNAIRKYGIDNFEIEILCEANSKEELNQLEIEYINKYSSYYLNNEKGYNMTIGGEGANGYKLTHEEKRRCAETFKNYYDMKPEKRSELAKDVWATEGYKDKMSQKQKDFLENNPEEKIRRIERLINSSKENSEKHSIFMKSFSNRQDIKGDFKNRMIKDRNDNVDKYNKANEKRKETMNTVSFKQNMSIKKRNILNIFQVFNQNNELLGEYDNTVDCKRELKLHDNTSIKKCLDGKLQQSCGYIFKYKNN